MGALGARNRSACPRNARAGSALANHPDLAVAGELSALIRRAALSHPRAARERRCNLGAFPLTSGSATRSRGPPSGARHDLVLYNEQTAKLDGLGFPIGVRMKHAEVDDDFTAYDLFLRRRAAYTQLML